MDDFLHALEHVGVNKDHIHSLSVEDGVVTLLVYATFQNEDGDAQVLNMETPFGKQLLMYKVAVSLSDLSHSHEEPIPAQ